MKPTRRTGLLAAITLAAAAWLPAQAQDAYPSKPIRLDTPIPKNGGGGGQRPPGRPAARGHARPAARPTTHAGPKQHRAGGQGAYAGKRNAPRGTRA